MKNKKVVRFMAILIVAAMVIMTMGYLFMFFGDESVISGSLFVDVAYADDAVAKERLSYLEDVIEYIQRAYADKLDYEELVNAAFAGVMDKLDDWSVYYYASEGASDIANSLESTYSGVGLTMQQEGEKVVITAVNKKGPAYEAGILVGGFIVKVDGVSTNGMTINEVANKIRGKEGTKVKVSIQNGITVTEYTLTRRTLQIDSLGYEMKDGNIGYICVDSFSENTAREFEAAYSALLSQGAKSIIMDLRYNTGGYLDVAVDIADQLMDSGVIYYAEQQGKIISTVKATADNIKTLPMVILTNEYTASASELLAAALQKNGLAKTVGTTTYGKGLAQSIVPVINGDSLKLSNFYFLAPDKSKLHGAGVKPDYIVYNGAELSSEEVLAIKSKLADLNLKQRYFAGQKGYNVFAAQQRLQILGYDVELTSYMDEKTIEALKDIQKDAGSASPYGGLDYFTLKALNSRFDTYLNSGKDNQLEKAIELLK